MIGCRKNIRTISGQHIDLEIRPGVETGVEFASNGHGFTSVQTRQKGRFVAIVKIKARAITNPDIINRLRQLDAEITQRG
jgi:DnaJ-class molecular chaperone